MGRVDNAVAGRSVAPTRGGNLLMGQQPSAAARIVMSPNDKGVWTLQGPPKLAAVAPGSEGGRAVTADLQRMIEHNHEVRPPASVIDDLRGQWQVPRARGQGVHGRRRSANAARHQCPPADEGRPHLDTEPIRAGRGRGRLPAVHGQGSSWPTCSSTSGSLGGCAHPHPDSADVAEPPVNRPIGPVHRVVRPRTPLMR